jgi:type IV secretion system protein VirB1
MDLLAMIATCAPLVAPSTAAALIAVESGGNPHAIGVVGGRLERQPRAASEALATAQQLQRDGWNYSVGLAQINQANFGRLGLSPRSALDPCANLRAMQAILGECYDRAAGDTPQSALRRALSCYYSGNFVTGFRDGYVARVVAAATATRAKRARAPHRRSEVQRPDPDLEPATGVPRE